MAALTISNLYLIAPEKKQSEMLSQFTREYTAPSSSIVTYSFERLNYQNDLPICIQDFQRIKTTEVFEHGCFSFPDVHGKQLPLKQILATKYQEQYLIDLIIHLYFHLLSPHLIIDLIHDFLLIKSAGGVDIELAVMKNLEQFILINAPYMFSSERINYEWSRRESADEIKVEIDDQISLYDFTICMYWQTLTSLQMLTKYDISKVIKILRLEFDKINSYPIKTIEFVQNNFQVNLASSFCWRYNLEDLAQLCSYWSTGSEWKIISRAFSNQALLASGCR